MVAKHAIIVGTIEITEDAWTWDANLQPSDLDFLDKVNPNSAVTFKRHLKGADSCEKHMSDHAKFLKCLQAVNKL